MSLAQRDTPHVWRGNLAHTKASGPRALLEIKNRQGFTTLVGRCALKGEAEARSAQKVHSARWWRRTRHEHRLSYVSTSCQPEESVGTPVATVVVVTSVRTGSRTPTAA